MQWKYLTSLLAGCLALAACGAPSGNLEASASNPGDERQSTAMPATGQQPTVTPTVRAEPITSAPPNSTNSDRQEGDLRADDVSLLWGTAASRHGTEWLGLSWNVPLPSEPSTEIPDWAQELADEKNIEFAVSEERGGIFAESFDPDPLAPSGMSTLRATTRSEERFVTTIQLEILMYSAASDGAARIESGWRVLLHVIDPDLSAEDAEAALNALDVATLTQISQDPGADTTLLANWTGKAKCTAVYIAQTVVLSCEMD